MRQNIQFQTDQQLATALKILRLSLMEGLINKQEHTEFTNQGIYDNYLYQALQKTDPAAVAECIFGYLSSSLTGNGQVQFPPANFQYLNTVIQDPDHIPGVTGQFIELLKETNHTSAIFEAASPSECNLPFIKEVLTTLLMSEEVLISASSVRKAWRTIREILISGSDELPRFETFLIELPDFDDLLSGIYDDSFRLSRCRPLPRAAREHQRK